MSNLLTRRAFCLMASSWTGWACLRANPLGRESAADILIVSGSTGGVAAALAACRAGAKRVILTEETPWIGGQLTSQIVPPDEHKWIETTGATQSYRDFRKAVRDIYRTRKDKPIRPGVFTPTFNPGGCWVSHIGHEPKVGLAVLEAMLAPFVESGQLTILRSWRPIRADVQGDTVRSVTLRDLREGNESTITARYFLDATDEGDLLPLTKTEHVTGSESQAETGEPNAPAKARPGNIQSFTWCFALEHHDGAEHVIEKPKEYDFWRKFPGEGGEPLFNWEKPAFAFWPRADRDPGQPKRSNLWTYRRIIDAKKFQPGSYGGDVSVINWPQNDYTLGSLHASPPDDAAKHRERARQMSLSLLFWLQTECPRSDGQRGWPGLKLAADQTGTRDGLALAPYIRESRRIRAVTTVLEQHVSRPVREKEYGKETATAEVFEDSCGVGHYLYMDLHQTCEGESKGGWPVFPFQIPLGALIPRRVTNLLAACKNLGVTHLTNGCYRLHPVEWNIGEAAGALAAFCVQRGLTPKQVRESKRDEYQRLITDQGFVIEWPIEIRRG